jgi:hypothetical protein
MDMREDEGVRAFEDGGGSIVPGGAEQDRSPQRHQCVVERASRRGRRVLERHTPIILGFLQFSVKRGKPPQSLACSIRRSTCRHFPWQWHFPRKRTSDPWRTNHNGVGKRRDLTQISSRFYALVANMLVAFANVSSRFHHRRRRL